MSASTSTLTRGTIAARARSTRRTRRSWVLTRTTIAVGAIAAAFVTVAAALLHAVGVSFEIDGEMIPLLGFAQMTFVGAVIGGFVLAGLNRWSVASRRRFLQVAVLLTALSCIPSVAMPDDVATKLALVTLHLVAAAIIVPVLLRHAHD
jgi:uncharacterized protein DUF6069